MSSTTTIEGNVEITTMYFLHFDRNDSPGAGFCFPCDEHGNVDADLPDCAKSNLAGCLDGTFDVSEGRVEKSIVRSPLCSCGSGEHPENVHDARGIFVARVCTKCRRAKLGKYRKDIFTDSNYWHDEPISDEHWDY